MLKFDHLLKKKKNC